MSEPTRLIDETQSEFERALLHAGMAHVEDPLRRARVLAAIGVGAAVALGTKSSTAALLTWKKAVAGVAIAASGVGGVAAYQSFSVSAHHGRDAQVVVQDSPHAAGLGVASRTSPVTDAAPVPAPRETLDVPRAEAPAGEPLLGELSEPSTEGAAAKRRPPRSGSLERQSLERQSLERQSLERQGKPARGERVSEEPAEKASVSSASDLQAEVAYLDRARSALRAGRPASTLEQLGGYRRTFPNGSLGLEAEVLRIEALTASGRRDEASRRASRLLERSPNSVVADRLRRFVRE